MFVDVILLILLMIVDYCSLLLILLIFHHSESRVFITRDDLHMRLFGLHGTCSHCSTVRTGLLRLGAGD